ncbi:RDD family protein [Pedobacter sp. ISL-68]|uniref:RDD family protein n=1 Tax=unclassified Pedobacter TaxID=2628915 RepID=UPI001BE53EC6|nr:MULTISPECIES: RDD family protein [unclassified Pedobacter]MBT2563293.1 RDD family protein [Pedobacter sp. ISL-64]MBT2588666.1 RDD family protein [Pedobacter sp. ISL-68]
MNFNNNYLEINLDYCRASTGKRFVNYIIDVIVFYILAFGLGIVIGVLKPSLLVGVDDLSLRLVSLLFYGIVMFVTEAMSNGRSIGKLVTGTRAVNEDGSDMSFQKIFVRNIVRAIPFNALSALGTPSSPWHDRWSDTMVVDEKKLALQTQRVDLFDSVKNQTQ